jgi:hypothetical protein
MEKSVCLHQKKMILLGVSLLLPFYGFGRMVNVIYTLKIQLSSVTSKKVATKLLCLGQGYHCAGYGKEIRS